MYGYNLVCKCPNGYIRTDLGQLGIFLLCAGGFMAGGGATKAIAEMNRKKQSQTTKTE